MLIYFTDAQSNVPIAVNPQNVVSVFTASDGEMIGKTVIIFNGGNLAVTESELDVVGRINGELNNSGGCGGCGR